MVDHNKQSTDSTITAVAAQLKADDGSFRVAVVVRDKQRPYDEPTAIRAMGLEDIQNFVDNIPDQVHYVILNKAEKNNLLKVSLSAKTGNYNVFCNSMSLVSKSFDSDLLLGISSKLEPELCEEWSVFLSEE